MYNRLGAASFKEDMQALKTKEAQFVEDGSEAHLSLNTIGTVKIHHAASANFLLSKTALQSEKDVNKTNFGSEEQDVLCATATRENRTKITIPDPGRSRVLTGVDAHSTEVAMTSMHSSFHRNMQPIGVKMALHPRKASQGQVSQTGVSDNEDLKSQMPELKTDRRKSIRFKSTLMMGEEYILGSVDKTPTKTHGVKSAVNMTPKQEQDHSAVLDRSPLTSTAKQQRQSINAKKVDILDKLETEVPIHRSSLKARQIRKQSDKKTQKRRLP